MRHLCLEMLHFGHVDVCGVAFPLSALTERPTGWREFIHR